MRVLDRLEEVLICTLLALGTLIIFVAVLHRYGAGVPFLYPYLAPIDMSWAQELCIYLFVWMAKFGAAYGVRSGIHVGVDVLAARLSPEKRKPLVLFALFCGALFTAIVASLGAVFVYNIWHHGQVSNDLEVPMWIVYLAIPLGSSLMCFRFLSVMWSYLRTGVLPVHDHSKVEGIEPVEQIPMGAAR